MLLKTLQGSSRCSSKLAAYKNLLKNSQNYNKFWAMQARARLNLHRDFQTTSSIDFENAKFAWFAESQINVKENCVDRHIFQEHPALIYEHDEAGVNMTYSYLDLQKLVHKIAYKLVNLGVKKGDTVAIYMPTNPESVATMLACAQIGAVHNVVFAGFSAKALAERMDDSQCRVLVTSESMIRGGKEIPIYQKIVREAIQSCSTIKSVLIQNENDNFQPGKVDKNAKSELVDFHPLEHDLEKSSAPEHTQNEVMNAEDNLFILYTSGSTGKPKGIVHTQTGYLLYAGITHQYIFDYQPGDIYACVADIGWITGHSYVVYGPLVNGATSVLFGSTPTYPDYGRYWEMVERLKINQFYTSPTAIRLLYGQKDEYFEKYDLSSLKVLGTVGEPIGSEPWKWYHEKIGKGNCDIADTYWSDLGDF